MALALVGLGSNLEPRRAHLAFAASELDQAPLKRLRLSSLYETAPMDVLDQPAFLNQAALLEAKLLPQELLLLLQAIEVKAGKQVLRRRGPRTLDLDLWDCGGAVMQDKELTLPHPRLAQRPFALIPLAEIDPQWKHPLLGLNANELLAQIPQPWPAVRKVS